MSYLTKEELRDKITAGEYKFPYRDNSDDELKKRFIELIQMPGQLTEMIRYVDYIPYNIPWTDKIRFESFTRRGIVPVERWAKPSNISKYLSNVSGATPSQLRELIANYYKETPFELPAEIIKCIYEYIFSITKRKLDILDFSTRWGENYIAALACPNIISGYMGLDPKPARMNCYYMIDDFLSQILQIKKSHFKIDNRDFRYLQTVDPLPNVLFTSLPIGWWELYPVDFLIRSHGAWLDEIIFKWLDYAWNFLCEDGIMAIILDEKWEMDTYRSDNFIEKFSIKKKNIWIWRKSMSISAQTP